TIDRDELRHLARAIAAMPLKTQQAFVLRRVRGLSQREVAAHMRISENTVETHISRGVLFLIDWFGRSGNKRSQTSKTMNRESASRHGRARNPSRH
ncbi:MAG: RNA polymerase subunit sigma-24, partial [Caulobacter sp.]|nr:RNA polymerase subunit sigma-24 [Caulobacter sp.]